MGIRIGITGAHRTGKTTLAEAAASECGLQFIRTEVSEVFRSLGMATNVSHSAKDRLFAQQKILSHHADMWAAAGDNFITDRTPLDFIAYTLMNIRQEELTAEIDAEVTQYIRECVRLANEQFDAIILVSPAIEPVHADGKGAIFDTAIMSLHYMLNGILDEFSFAMDDFDNGYFPCSIPAEDKSLDARIEFVKKVKRAINE